MSFLQLTKILFFMLVFNIDVHVKAEAMYPLDCWPHARPCVLQAEERFLAHLESTKFGLEAASVLSVESDFEAKLMQGSLYLDVQKHSFLLSLPSSKLVVLPGAKIKLSRQDWGFRLWVLDGQAELSVARSREKLKIPAYHRLDWSWMTQKGLVDVSFPQTFNVTEWNNLMAYFYPKTESQQWKSIFQKKITEWQAATEDSSERMTAFADRQIAQAQESEERKLQIKRRLEKENRELRQIFRQKNLIE